MFDRGKVVFFGGSRDGYGFLVVDVEFEVGRVLFDKVEGRFGFESSDCGVVVMRDDIVMVEKSNSYVFVVVGIVDDYLVVGFEV